MIAESMILLLGFFYIVLSTDLAD